MGYSGGCPQRRPAGGDRPYLATGLAIGRGLIVCVAPDLAEPRDKANDSDQATNRLNEKSGVVVRDMRSARYENCGSNDDN